MPGQRGTMPSNEERTAYVQTGGRNGGNTHLHTIHTVNSGEGRTHEDEVVACALTKAAYL